MKLRNSLYFIVIVFFIISCSGKNTFDRSVTDINKRMDGYLELEYQDGQFPGIQYVIFNNEKILYSYTGGYEKISEKKKMTPGSVLNVFSSTKLVTGVAVLQLVQQGKLKLSDKVVKHYPEIPYKDITIGQVLSHSSGITNAILGNYYVHWVDEHKEYNRDKELLLALEENELDFTPGTEIGYSNMAYGVLGKVIENVSGLKYEEYITKNVFNRLNLDKNKINFGTQQQENAALPYFRRFSLTYNFLVLFLSGSETRAEGDWTSFHGPFYINQPAHGGIVASAFEYAKIFMDLMRGEQAKLLSPELIEKMFSKQIKYDDTIMAISWYMGELNSRPYVYHQGGGLGYIAEVRIYPNEKLGSIILMNRSDSAALKRMDVLDNEFISHLKK